MPNTPAIAQDLVRDRAEIERLASLVAWGNDVDPEYYDQCMCDDVEIVYSFAEWRGLEEHKRRCREYRSVFTFTQHLLANPLIEVDGDSATAKYYVFASHGWKATGGKDIIYAGAIYTHDLVRTAKGWLIKRHHCETLWYDDPKELMQMFPVSAGTRDK
jgi:hypothetical protein